MEHTKAMVYGSLIGDSLALGVHWIYNVRAIEKRVGRIDDLIAPVVKTFHPNRKAGEFTHYGDQVMLLLSFCAERRGKRGAGDSGPSNIAGTSGPSFDGAAFLSLWAEYMEGYDGYMDKASKATLENYRKLSDEEKANIGFGEASAGGDIDDLAGASRIAPVIYHYRDDREVAVHAAKAQTAVTHNVPSVIESAGFFADLTFRVLSGESPKSAAWSLAEQEYAGGTIAPLVIEGLDSEGRDTGEAIAEFGQACSVRKGLPSVMHLISTYENNVKEALVESTMAGGDSAARNLAVGMILAAYRGLDGLPKKWLDGLAAKEKIEKLL